MKSIEPNSPCFLFMIPKENPEIKKMTIETILTIYKEILIPLLQLIYEKIMLVIIDNTTNIKIDNKLDNSLLRLPIKVPSPKSLITLSLILISFKDQP